VYAQAKDASERGLPMVRALFVEYPDDPGACRSTMNTCFGSDILVAPLMEPGMTSRDVYLPQGQPQGQWIDYQTNKVIPGAGTTFKPDRFPW